MAGGGGWLCLPPAENARLAPAFAAACAANAALPGASLLSRLQKRLTPAAYDQVAARSSVAGAGAVFGGAELARLLAWAELVEQQLGRRDPLHVEVRVEGWKAYALVPPEDSFVGAVAGRPLLWVHDEAWATARFGTPGGPDFGLCGQFVGRSKFVSAADAFPATKGDALDALGLRGYDAFDKPGTLHVVHAQLPPALSAEAQPLVPVLYLEGRNDNADAAQPSHWVPAPNFQEGTVPGYTSGLKCELVIKSFRVEAASVAELAEKGLRCVALGD